MLTDETNNMPCDFCENYYFMKDFYSEKEKEYAELRHEIKVKMTVESFRGEKHVGSIGNIPRNLNYCPCCGKKL